MGLEETNSDKDILQTAFDGFFEENSLPHSTKIIPCFDNESAYKTVRFIKKFFDVAAAGSLSDINYLSELLKDYFEYLPRNVSDCLKSNDDTISALAAYGHPE